MNCEAEFWTSSIFCNINKQTNNDDHRCMGHLGGKNKMWLDITMHSPLK